MQRETARERVLRERGRVELLTRLNVTHLAPSVSPTSQPGCLPAAHMTCCVRATLLINLYYLRAEPGTTVCSLSTQLYVSIYLSPSLLLPFLSCHLSISLSPSIPPPPALPVHLPLLAHYFG